jgi:hypothetical protein
MNAASLIALVAGAMALPVKAVDEATTAPTRV